MGTTGWRSSGVRLSHPLFFLSLALPGDETFLFCGGWWVFVWWLVLCFCLCCCFGSVFCFKLSHSLLFTQKLWRFSGLSERALDLLLGLCLGVPSISRLFNLDCRYPRDQLQPARKKKTFIGQVVHCLRQDHYLPGGSARAWLEGWFAKRALGTLGDTCLG